ncbi:hypothetical protein AJ80_05192 [Polytolypa hystricis UAMH7299]|uniref:ABC transporter domain-containing protein n=1 Tax=Polytolypa hystricis (strain UAMH7299) TaxID=1447883 RepID=A0A2B7Y7C5_POLH7|nr:hypothetical protein AJ80_05192 [Polytolypa hystricis UAMH7299]
MIINALKSVQLSTIVKEEGGLDIHVEEQYLPHGQRQLLCLAKAILHPSTILILDEATSNVGKTDEIMQRVLRERLSSHTIIIVAHKLDTTLDFDKVAVLAAGELIEFDDLYTLLFRNIAFSKLCASTMVDQPGEVSAVVDIKLTSGG